jgi:hypothetical protein
LPVSNYLLLVAFELELTVELIDVFVSNRKIYSAFRLIVFLFRGVFIPDDKVKSLDVALLGLNDFILGVDVFLVA